MPTARGKGLARDLESEIAKVEEGTTEQILEYLAMITGNFEVMPIFPRKEGEKTGYVITFKAINEQLGIEFHASSGGKTTTIREAAIFATKGAIAWYQPWRDDPETELEE